MVSYDKFDLYSTEIDGSSLDIDDDSLENKACLPPCLYAAPDASLRGNLDINLDITALFAFISNLSNGRAAGLSFQSKTLSIQSMLECRCPIMPF